jgi:hypothetical protein
MINFNPQDEEGKASQAREEFLERVTIDDLFESSYAEIDKEITQLKLQIGSERMYLQERQNAVKKT